MRNFYKLGDGAEVQPILHTLSRKPHLWNRDDYRTTFENTPFADNDDILLKFNPREECDQTQEKFLNSVHSTVWYEAAKELPEIQIPILNLMRYVKAYELERCLISRLKPGAKILPHADNKGEYVNTGEVGRYHIVLQGLPGSLFHCGGETVNMRTGEIWWFNAHEVHAVENNSADDRIHLLVDVRYMP